MKTIKNYKILKADSDEEMYKYVAEAINKGWQPLDGCVIIPTASNPADANDQGGLTYFQTIGQT